MVKKVIAMSLPYMKLKYAPDWASFEDPTVKIRLKDIL